MKYLYLSLLFILLASFVFLYDKVDAIIIVLLSFFSGLLTTSLLTLSKKADYEAEILELKNKNDESSKKLFSLAKDYSNLMKEKKIMQEINEEFYEKFAHEKERADKLFIQLDALKVQYNKLTKLGPKKETKNELPN